MAPFKIQQLSDYTGKIDRKSYVGDGTTADGGMAGDGLGERGSRSDGLEKGDFGNGARVGEVVGGGEGDWECWV